MKVSKSSTEKVMYVYDATGVKVKKVAVNDGTVTCRYYAGAFEYDNVRALSLIRMDEGVVNVSGNTFTNEYHLKDHLGNVRVAFIPGRDSLSQVTDYYPFGMISSSTSYGSDNKYLYNGKELQTELGMEWYDYGARFYDPQIGRWMTADPLDQYYSLYTFNGDNALNSIDEDGKSGTLINNNITAAVVNQGGKIIYWNPNDKDKNIYLSPDGIRGSDGNTEGLEVVGTEAPGVSYTQGFYWYGFYGLNTTGILNPCDFPVWMLRGEAIEPIYPEKDIIEAILSGGASFYGKGALKLGLRISGKKLKTKVLQKTMQEMRYNPPPSEMGFEPPKKGGNRRVKDEEGRKGWLDKYGDIWVPDTHGGLHRPHYDVQHPDGSHTQVAFKRE